MGKVIEFPNRSRGWVTCPTFGALALAPEEIEDCPAEIPSEEPKRQVEVIPFPGAWDTPEETTAVPRRSVVCILKIRIVCRREFSETFSRAYVDAPIPLSADVHRLASRSPPSMVVCDAENPYNYISRQYDVQTDLYYLRARYYNARTGRFISQDPFLGNPYDPRTLHRYTYAYQSPTTYYDLTGYFATQAVSSLAGFAGGIINAGFQAIFDRPDQKQPERQPTSYQIAAEKGNGQVLDADPGLQKRIRDEQRLKESGEIRTVSIWDDPFFNLIGAAKSVFQLGRALVVAVRGAGEVALGEVSTFGARSLGAAEVRILQTGGNTIRSGTAKALNEAAGVNVSPREWGRALEALKKGNSLPPNFHGKITSTGDYLDEAGNLIDNIMGYLP